MNITILNGSPRKNGNTQIMAEAFARGARESGSKVTVIDTAYKQVKGCLGCEYCFSHEGTCVQKDDMGGILEILDETDVLVFASPIYWFDMTAQIKAVIDRMYARAVKGFHFSKTVLLLNAGADEVFDAAIAQYRATLDYLKWEDLGIITIPNMENKGSMKESPQLEDVYRLGKAVGAGEKGEK